MSASTGHCVTERATRQLVRRMVSALEVTFQLPPGDQLVSVLGTGHERSNHEALYSWTTRELQQLHLELAPQHLPRLVERLHRTLTDWDHERYLG